MTVQSIYVIIGSMVIGNEIYLYKGNRLHLVQFFKFIKPLSYIGLLH